MAAVTVSPKYQVVIPQAIQEADGLEVRGAIDGKSRPGSMAQFCAS